MPTIAVEIRPMTAQQVLAAETSVPVPFHEILRCLGDSKKIKISHHHHHQGQEGRRTMHGHHPEKGQSLSMNLRYWGDLTRKMVILQRRMAITEKIKTRRIDRSHHRKSQVWRTSLR
jgi:hypothetical protein